MASDSLLDVAIRQFGDRGFDGASTRSIAAEAGTVMSSITYRYGGKEGLYLACVDYIADQLALDLGPSLDAIVQSEPLDGAAATDAVAGLVEKIGWMMLSPASEDWAQFIIREQHKPGPAFERLYLRAVKRIADTLVRLVRIARPKLDEAGARAVGITLYGQALVLRAAHAEILRGMETDRLSEAQQDLLIRTIRTNVYAILKSDTQP